MCYPRLPREMSLYSFTLGFISWLMDVAEYLVEVEVEVEVQSPWPYTYKVIRLASKNAMFCDLVRQLTVRKLLNTMVTGRVRCLF